MESPKTASRLPWLSQCLSGLTLWSLAWVFVLVLVGWMLAHLPLSEILNILAALTLPQWLLWIGVNLAIAALATARWWLLIRILKQPVRFGWLMQARQAGQAVNIITPGPQCGGEPLQIYWLFKHGLPLHKALLSLGLDRFYELAINLAVLLLALLLLLFSPVSLPLEQMLGSPTLIDALLVVLLVLMAVAWILLRQPRWIFNRLQKLVLRWGQDPRLNTLKTYKQSLANDWRLVLQKEKAALVIAGVLSLCGWAALLGELGLLLDFAGIKLDIHVFILILVALRLAILLPIPAGIGTLEAAIYWVCITLDLPTSAAIALIALMRLRDVLVLLAGLGCLRRMQTQTATLLISHQQHC